MGGPPRAQSDVLDGFRAVVIDSEKAEELAVEHTLATVRTDKGGHAKTLEDYNWGKGPTHVYDVTSNCSRIAN